MAFRVVLVENELDMRVKLDNLVVRKEEKDIWIPISDISIIILDNLKISLTARMLCTLAKNNVGVIICDMEHLPIGYYSSYDNHSRVSKNIKYQIMRDEKFYNELWEKIVIEKIKNQIEVLSKLEKSQDVILDMEKFLNEINDGDKSNREGHAAKIYFNELMGTSFSRRNDDILLNSGLNYGYTIIRSYLARLCVGYGLNTQIGIHHKNEYNRFNLVDDIIEPIRAFVDLYSYLLLENEEYFKLEHRRNLINFLNHKIVYKNKKMFFCNMLEEYVCDISNYISGKSENIAFPKLKDYIGEGNEV